AAHAMPIGHRDALAREIVTWAGCRAHVLHGAGNVVRRAVVYGNVIELSDRQGRSVPGFAAVERDVHAAVVAVDHALWVGRVDPEIVWIDVMRTFDLFERFAAVETLE